MKYVRFLPTSSVRYRNSPDMASPILFYSPLLVLPKANSGYCRGNLWLPRLLVHTNCKSRLIRMSL